MAPLVSIMIPVYNRETLIGKCIESAINQTIKDIEIIIVDNCSTDKTLRICEMYAQRDNRVKIYKNKQNLGPVLNWGMCIKYSTGMYGKFLFSDDMMAPNYLEKTLMLINKEDVGFVYTATIIGESDFNGKLEYSKEGCGLYDSKRFIYKTLFSNNDTPVSPGCALFRLHDLKENLMINFSIQSVNDFNQHGAGPDLLLYLLTATKYKYYGFVKEPLSFFRSHPNSITISDKSKKIINRYKLTKLWFVIKYCDRKIAVKVILRSWLGHLYNTRKYISVIRYQTLFTDEPIKITIFDFLLNSLDILKYLFQKIVNKILSNIS